MGRVIISNVLIKMPGAPIDFDLDVLGRLTPVIGIIKDDYMKIEDFCKRTGISYDRLNKLEGAIVVEDGLVRLSPLGSLLYRRYLYRAEFQVLIFR